MILTAAIISGYWNKWSTSIGPLFGLYAVEAFFNNFGPNASTYLIPAEVFPAGWRSTAHGISAACGKIGAVAGTFGFSFMTTDIKNNGYGDAFALLSACSGIGFLVTFLIPEGNQKSLEELGHDEVQLVNEHGGDALYSPEKVDVYSGVEFQGIRAEYNTEQHKFESTI